MSKAEQLDQHEIDQALQHERVIEPSRYDQVPVPNRYSFVVRDQLEVTPVVQQGFDTAFLAYDSEGRYITNDW